MYLRMNRNMISYAQTKNAWLEGLKTRKQEQELECGEKIKTNISNGEESGSILLKWLEEKPRKLPSKEVKSNTDSSLQIELRPVRDSGFEIQQLEDSPETTTGLQRTMTSGLVGPSAGS